MKTGIGLLVVAATMLTTQSGFSQSSTVYLEGATCGPLYSVNYDRVFYTANRVSYAYRIGFHWLNDDIALPVGVSMISGKRNHHAELSITATPFVDRANYLFRSGNYSDKKIYITPAFGYRFQKYVGGLFVRAAAGPTILLDPRSDNFWTMDPKLFAVLSIGAGYTF